MDHEVKAPQLIQEAALHHVLSARQRDAHKGSCGSVAIIGGDGGMVGAALLAARAALFTGAGRIYAALLSKNAPAVDILHPEIMLRSPDDLASLKQLDCVAIGPGLGQSLDAIELLIWWLTQPKWQSMPIVLDADALNLIAEHAHLAQLLKQRRGATVITPHAGEAARLLGLTTESVQRDRLQSAACLADTFNVICVLKGADSICAHTDGTCFMNSSGNPALASGGSGDVLTGVIASLVAQGVTPLDAAKLGVFAHGLAADHLVARGIGPRGLTASEVLLEVRDVINGLSQAREVG